jgi:hypothetical protein
LASSGHLKPTGTISIMEVRHVKIKEDSNPRNDILGVGHLNKGCNILIILKYKRMQMEFPRDSQSNAKINSNHRHHTGFIVTIILET